MLILLFLTPVVADICADIAANVNIAGTAMETIIEFIPVLYVLSILAGAAFALFKAYGDNF